jgi:lysophospholipase L1-like esterase
LALAGVKQVDEAFSGDESTLMTSRLNEKESTVMTAPRSPFRRFLINGTLLFVSCALAVGVLELFVRIFYQDQVETSMYQRSETRSYELKPNITFTSPTGVLNYTNSLGLPEREIPLAKKPGEFRVVVIGDSCTQNADVTPSERFTTLLEERLNAAAFSPVTVINAGVSGYNIDQMITTYEEVGRRYNPDLVVLHYLIQDSFRRSLVNETFLQLPNFVQDLSLFIYDNSALVRKMRRVAHALTTEHHLKQLGTVEKFEHSEAWKHTQDQIKTFSRKLATENVEFVLLLFTFQSEPKKFIPFYKEVERFGAQAGIPVVTTYKAYDSYQGSLIDLWVSPEDSHPNGTAMTFIADAITPVVQERLVIIQEEQQKASPLVPTP